MSHFPPTKDRLSFPTIHSDYALLVHQTALWMAFVLHVRTISVDNLFVVYFGGSRTIKTMQASVSKALHSSCSASVGLTTWCEQQYTTEDWLGVSPSTVIGPFPHSSQSGPFQDKTRRRSNTQPCPALEGDPSRYLISLPS